MTSEFDGGIGVDIVEVERIQAAWRRFGARFVNRLFTPAEIRHCLAKARPAESLAARFAAKEAFAKAWSGPELPGWHDVEVVMEGPKPAFRLRGSAAGTAAQLSLSHTHRYAVAMVRLGRPGGGGTP